ncbi:hypothetical protein ACLFMI_15530 [Pseudonocardia nantongensis]|uniref:hypothetical protein n=1 Tax=Pseudonocardia nantongensis TaxID=1181885 RepID=UPI00397C8938
MSLGVPAASAGSAAPGAAPRPACTVEDPRVAELSGLVAAGPAGAPASGYHAVVDGDGPARVYTLDPGTCAVTGVREAQAGVTDVEDLGTTPDGTLWLADIGDNPAQRDTVRLVVVPPSGPARVHELTYPDGPRDAEAILVSDDGVPLIVDKTTGAAGVYRPATPLDGAPGPVPMTRVADVVLPWSGTSGGPLGPSGSRTVTGAAVGPAGSPDRVAALRTYTDAWLFRLPAGAPADADALVTALRGSPLPVPLPDEPQGEAVALDGQGTLHSGSETRGLTPAAIRVVPGAAAAATAPAAPVVGQPMVAPRVGTVPDWLPAAAGSAVVVVLLLAGAGAMVLHGRRRRRG